MAQMKKADAATAKEQRAVARARGDSIRADSFHRIADSARNSAETARTRAAEAEGVRRSAVARAAAASLAARTALDSVEARRRTARALHFANRATAVFDTTPDGLVQSLLLSLESLRTEWSVEGTAVWARAMALLPPRMGILRAHATPITALALSPDGSRLASSTGDGPVALWSVRAQAEDVTLVPAFAGGAYLPASSGAQKLVFSPDGRMLAAGRGNEVMVWKIDGPRPTVTLSRRLATLYDLDFSPDGRWLAVAEGYWVQLLDTRDSAGGGRLERERGAAVRVAFSPDGRLLAVAGTRLQVWDVETRRRLADGQSNGTLREIRFSPDGTQIVAGHERWQVGRGGDSLTLSRSVESERAGGAGTAGYAARASAIPGTMDTFGVSVRTTMDDEVSRIPIHATAMAQGAKWLALGNVDGSISLWSMIPRQETARLSVGPGRTSVAFSGDGRWLAMAGPGTTRVVTADTRRELMVRAEGSSSLRFTPDGRWLLAATDSSVRAYATTDAWRTAGSVRTPGSWQRWLSADGRRLAILSTHMCGHGSESETRVWDIANGALRQVAWQWPGCSHGWEGQYAPPPSVDPTGLAEQARLWPTFSMPPRSANGHWAAAGAGSAVVRLLDASTGREVAQFVAAADTIDELALSPDGNWLATAGGDGTVRLWRLGPAEAMIADACARLPRNLTFDEWKRAFGNQPYRRTCPQLPDPAPAPATAPAGTAR
jgi:WD40 repeat protein